MSARSGASSTVCSNAACISRLRPTRRASCRRRMAGRKSPAPSTRRAQPSARRAQADVAIRPKLLLFDLDGVLVEYSRELRCRRLARTLDVDEAEVRRALFERGLESRSD